MRYVLWKNRCRIVLLIIGLAVSGCKEILYSDLDEIQANEMVAILATVGVSSSREVDKDGIYALLVDEQNIATAITILKKEGYPRERFESLGDIFSAEGIIGTPFEQQARFIHALNQELSYTMTSISGVRNARVFVTVPSQSRYDRSPPRATASVTLHHDPSFAPSNNIAKIKQIVSFSVPNLAYDDVAVALFPARGPTITENLVNLEAAEIDLEPSSEAPTVSRSGIALDVPTVLDIGLENLNIKMALRIVAIVGLILAAHAFWIRSSIYRKRNF